MFLLSLLFVKLEVFLPFASSVYRLLPSNAVQDDSQVDGLVVLSLGICSFKQAPPVILM